MMVMALASVGAFAQQAPGTFSVQPKIGLNLANLSGDYWESNLRVGVAVGAEGMYQVTDMFAVSGAVMYSMQGCKIKDGGGTVKLDYINLPILANVYFARNFAVKAGVQFGFNVNENVAPLKAKNFDLSIPIGLSYEYMNFVFDGRYNWGLTDVIKDSGLKNSVFQFTVGYKFAL